jgi:hypothetical protein
VVSHIRLECPPSPTLPLHTVHLMRSMRRPSAFIDEGEYGRAIAFIRGGVWSGGVSPVRCESRKPSRATAPSRLKRLGAVLTVYRAIDKHLGARYMPSPRANRAFAQQLPISAACSKDWPQMAAASDANCARCLFPKARLTARSAASPGGSISRCALPRGEKWMCFNPSECSAERRCRHGLLT